MSICLILVIVSGVLSSSLQTANAEGQTAELPKRTVGDKWKFTIDIKDSASTSGMIGTYFLEVTNEKVIIENYECYEFISDASGTVYGEDISGTWSMTGKTYYVKSDQSVAKLTSIIDGTITDSMGTSRRIQTTESIYDPPLGLNQGFPISAGKSWSSLTTQTTTTKADVDGQVTQETTPVTKSTNYLVVRIETTKVTAGEFETFVIKCTDNDGSIQEFYYSPKAQVEVKQLDYDAQGELSVSFELLEYTVAEPGIPFMYLVAAIVGAVAVVGIIVGLVAFKKRSVKRPYLPDPPSGENQ